MLQRGERLEGLTYGPGLRRRQCDGAVPIQPVSSKRSVVLTLHHSRGGGSGHGPASDRCHVSAGDGRGLECHRQVDQVAA